MARMPRHRTGCGRIATNAASSCAWKASCGGTSTASKKVTQKREEISRFLAARLDVDHIPAVRTAEASAEVVASHVGRELMALEQHDDYVTAMEQIRELQSDSNTPVGECSGLVSWSWRGRRRQR
jgi:hypothetical protein